MSTGIINWNAGTFLTSVADKVEHGMTLAVIEVEGYCKKLVSVQEETHVTRGGHTVGDDPSKPGEPPKKVLGELESHITHEVRRESDAIIGAIGIPAGSIPDDYDLRLELGFAGVDAAGRNVNQEPRPYLRPSVLRNRDRIVELIGKG